MKNSLFAFIITLSALAGFNYSTISISDITTIEDEVLVDLVSGENAIEAELRDLEEIKTVAITTKKDYNQIKSEYRQLELNNVLPEVDEDFFSRGADEPPLGIPGFVWGFCFGLIGLVIVYVAMEKGSAREKEAKNAMYGCLAGSAVSMVIYLVLVAATVQ